MHPLAALTLYGPVMGALSALVVVVVLASAMFPTRRTVAGKRSKGRRHPTPIYRR